jgi:GNAT superfamily N-acetyltransferase
MLTYERRNSLTDTVVALNLLRNVENYYPGFEYWYINKAMPGIMVGEDVLLFAKDNDKCVGVALGKKSEEEVKLRCVRVLPEYQKRGTGIHLIEKMLLELDCDKPRCTVSEELFHDFARPFIRYFDWDLDDAVKNLYRDNKVEYIWNSPEARRAKRIKDNHASQIN